MCRTPLHSRRQVLALQQCREHAGRERVAAAGAVGNWNVFAQWGAVHFAFRCIVQHRAPRNHVCVRRAAPLRADQTQVRIVRRDFFHSLLVRRNPFGVGRIVIHFGFVTKRVVQIAVIADEETQVRRDPLIDFARALFAWLDLGAVIQIGGDERAVRVRLLHRFNRQSGGRGRNQSVDAAGAEHAHAFLAEQRIPVHIAFAQFAHRRMRAIV